jgi:RNA polymerase sigma-70 factor, ECF subfamily
MLGAIDGPLKSESTAARPPAVRPGFGILDSRPQARAVSDPCRGPLRVRIDERSTADAAMDRYAAGDDAAFAVVYDALSARIFSYLRRSVGDLARAEALAQQTFLHMHRARGTFVSGSAVVPWAYAIARRLVIDELRRERRSVLATAQALADEPLQRSPDPSADDLLVARDLAQQLQSTIAILPTPQRAAFELVRLEGLSHTEAAEALGMTVNSVKLRVHRAYLALHSAVAGKRGEP